MAPPNDPVHSVLNCSSPEPLEKIFVLSKGKFSVRCVPLLTDVPDNVSFSPFSSVRLTQPSDVPKHILQRVSSLSHKGGFLGFSKDESSDRLMNSLGRFTARDFLSVFRFKTWWSTMWVGNSGSDLQKETQWILFDIPEIKSYLIIIPIIEGSFRSALHPGSDGHVMICAESCSTQVKASNFEAIAYVHLSENPYNLMKEAFSALRVHLNTFRLLEEKTVSDLVDKFGWCTWDAFYLTVEPAGVWQGVKDFAEGGFSPRFLIIDDGWQSINLDIDNPNEEAKNLILCGEQMTARLHRLDEGEKFRKYQGGSMLSPNSVAFDPKKPKLLISKAVELEHAKKDRAQALKSGLADLSEFDIKIKQLMQELNQILGKGDSSGSGQKCGRYSCESGNYGLKAFTRDLRTEFKGLDDIYVWHALCGAWGGVRPGTTHLNSKIMPCNVSPGLKGTMDDLAVEKIVEGGIGLVHPDQAGDFYDSMHSYLSKAGVTGVKVDVIHTLEYVSEEYGGRVELAKNYYHGLTKSVLDNFNGNGVISSMQQCNDFFFLGTKQISMGRVGNWFIPFFSRTTGDDFWFQDPNGDPKGVYWLQGVHMIHCAFNSMWMGQIIQPDWDMFQSDHLCAKFHAGSRAICGGPVYLSDSVGCHDFDLIKKLVYPDGTIPKCQHFALPSRDCLFKNPLFDKKTILKICNFNKYGGVVGAFNCQGGGWDPKERRIKGYPEYYKAVSGAVHLHDIEWDQKAEAAQMGKAEEYAVYLNQAGKLRLITPKSGPIEITIQPTTFELFSFVPLTKLSNTIKFAAIGLTNMFNSGGTIRELQYNASGIDMGAQIKVKGGGNFLAYSNVSPKTCHLNGVELAFEWSEDGRLSISVPWMAETGGISNVAIVF